MSVTWKIAGGTVASPTSLAQLGLSGLRLKRSSLARDELTFNAAGALIDSTALFAYGDAVTLIRDDTGPLGELKWFVGVCVQVPRAAVGGLEDTQYVIAGTWWYLENLVYQQTWPLDATANAHLTSPSTYRRAIIVAGLASTTGLRQNTKAFLADVIDWLQDSGDGPVLACDPDSLPDGFDVPFQRLDSPSCAEAIQAIVRWFPDAASWFNYTTTPPSLFIKRRGYMADYPAEFAVSDCTEVRVVPRHELKLDRLLIQFITYDAYGNTVLNEDKDPSGTTGREFGSAVITLDNNYQPLPAGLAENYREGLSVLQYSGHITIEEKECSQGIHPGILINLTGGAEEWETMQAQVQEIVEDIDTGKTTIYFGPAEHIRIDDFLEVLKIARNQADQFGGFSEILKTGNRGRNKALTAEITVAGVVATEEEIKDAIESAYAAAGVGDPRINDVVTLTVDGDLKFRAYIHSALAGPTGNFLVDFEVNGKTWYAHVHQTGIY